MYIMWDNEPHSSLMQTWCSKPLTKITIITFFLSCSKIKWYKRCALYIFLYLTTQIYTVCTYIFTWRAFAHRASVLAIPSNNFCFQFAKAIFSAIFRNTNFSKWFKASCMNDASQDVSQHTMSDADIATRLSSYLAQHGAILHHMDNIMFCMNTSLAWTWLMLVTASLNTT